MSANGFGRLRWAVAATVAAAALTGATVSSSAPPRAAKLDASVAGEGTITGRGLDCGERCDASYRRGSIVDVTASPGNNETFARWGGDCAGEAPICSLLLDRPTRVRAVFVANPQKVSMTVGGPGTIVSDPAGMPTVVGNEAGIRCGSQDDLCSAMFGQGRTIRLEPQPDGDGVFAGWGGACEGQPVDPARCDLTVGANEIVTDRATAWFRHRVAAFGPQSLTVDAYSGRAIVSSPQGIDCGEICSAPFAPATTVTLSGGAIWTGACVGTVNRCTVVTDAPVDVAARFIELNLGSTVGYGVTLTVTGKGRVTVGKRINCDGRKGRARVCSETFAPNAKITLVPKGKRFLGWKGDASCRRGPCRVSVIDSLQIGAMFAR